VILLDVEHIRDNVHIKPESGTNIGSLIIMRKDLISDIEEKQTSRRRVSVIPAPKNLHKWSIENLRKISMTNFSMFFAFFSGVLGSYGISDDEKSVL
jgi:hypothetical protein